MSEDSIVFRADSYKYTQWGQYPANTTDISEYIESRGGRFPETVFFGLQSTLFLLSRRVTQQDVNDADEFISAHIGPGVFNRAGWQHIVDKHEGKLPLAIYAVPEGTVVPTNNILVKVRPTDKESAWLPGFVETTLLRGSWYGTTVATLSYTVKKTIRSYLEETGDPALLPFKFHDFGARGVSSHESAGIGGAAHLVNFMGTDTVEGIRYAQKYYMTKAMIGFSIVASEHSTMTSWGGRSGELLSMTNLIEKFLKPGTIVACVSDSYDIYHAIIQHWGTTLKDKILASGGTLVIRPDSGDPVEVTLRCVELLSEKFGFHVNVKGFKVLHPSVRLIQGDGIDDVMVERILANFKAHGWSADNIAFGCGGGLLQKVNRDTQKFAMKASAIEVDGAWSDVFKDPITDPGKKSKRGDLELVYYPRTKRYATIRSEEIMFIAGDVEKVMQLVFLNGEVVKTYTFEQVRANSEKSLKDC